MVTSPESFSISDVARRTGVPQATLRSWESRFGVPSPQRLGGGHRRYREADVVLVCEILQERAAGLGLAAAVERARTRDQPVERSVSAGLRRRHPDLAPQVLRKRTLLALTRAIEDESCARAEHPLLFASFERQQFYLQSRARWRELALTADCAVVFADFPASRGPRRGSGRPSSRQPVEVAVPVDAPMRREWTIVCDAADQPACLTGWELPDQAGTPDAQRRFEAIWSVDPAVVRNAARICAQLAAAFAPGLELGLTERLAAVPARVSAEQRRGAGLLDRMLTYLDAVG